MNRKQDGPVAADNLRNGLGALSLTALMLGHGNIVGEAGGLQRPLGLARRNLRVEGKLREYERVYYAVRISQSFGCRVEAGKEVGKTLHDFHKQAPP